jgi:polynucleotide 5'-kinase involved in rRNA processing
VRLVLKGKQDQQVPQVLRERQVQKDKRVSLVRRALKDKQERQVQKDKQVSRGHKDQQGKPGQQVKQALLVKRVCVVKPDQLDQQVQDLKDQQDPLAME